MSIKCTCIEIARDKNGVKRAYRLKDENGMAIEMTADRVREALFMKQLDIDNLKLTSDGKIVDKKPEENNTNVKRVVALGRDKNGNNKLTTIPIDTVEKSISRITQSKENNNYLKFNDYISLREYKDSIDRIVDIFWRNYDTKGESQRLSNRDTYDINNELSSILKSRVTIIDLDCSTICSYGTLHWVYDTKYLFKFSAGMNNYLREKDPYYGYGFDSSGDKMGDMKRCVSLAIKLLLSNEEYSYIAMSKYALDKFIVQALNNVKTAQTSFSKSLYINKKQNTNGDIEYNLILFTHGILNKKDNCKIDINLVKLTPMYSYKYEEYIVDCIVANVFRLNVVLENNKNVPRIINERYKHNELCGIALAKDLKVEELNNEIANYLRESLERFKDFLKYIDIIF